MQKNYSNEDCYDILRIEYDCSWPEVRKSYKTLIQKWHPDRFTDDLEGKNTATSKIKELNLAYQQLENYYKEHGILPDLEYGQNEPELHSSMYSGEADNINADTKQQFNESCDYSSQPGKTYLRERYILVTVLVIVLAVIYTDFTSQLNSSKTSLKSKQQSDPKPAYNRQSNSRPVPEDSLLFLKDKNNAMKETPDDQSFFTYGATMGEVINSQGAPDIIDNNIWYYGKSEVHFKDGLVIKWKHDHNHPLHARVVVKNTIYNKHKLNK